MDVLAINGSPHMNEGNTAKILNPFLEGLKEAGANVELIYSWKLNIEPCSGDMSCWFVNPGTCAKDDDMKTILPKIKKRFSSPPAPPGRFPCSIRFLCR